MRPGGNNRTVTLVVAGLLVISVLLFVNFWYVDGQRKELKDELEMLDNRYQSLQKNKRSENIFLSSFGACIVSYL